MRKTGSGKLSSFGKAAVASAVAGFVARLPKSALHKSLSCVGIDARCGSRSCSTRIGGLRIAIGDFFHSNTCSLQAINFALDLVLLRIFALRNEIHWKEAKDKGTIRKRLRHTKNRACQLTPKQRIKRKSGGVIKLGLLERRSRLLLEFFEVLHQRLQVPFQRYQGFMEVLYLLLDGLRKLVQDDLLAHNTSGGILGHGFHKLV